MKMASKQNIFCVFIFCSCFLGVKAQQNIVVPDSIIQYNLKQIAHCDTTMPYQADIYPLKEKQDLEKALKKDIKIINFLNEYVYADLRKIKKLLKKQRKVYKNEFTHNVHNTINLNEIECEINNKGLLNISIQVVHKNDTIKQKLFYLSVNANYGKCNTDSKYLKKIIQLINFKIKCYNCYYINEIYNYTHNKQELIYFE